MQGEKIDLCAVLPVCDEEANIINVVTELCSTLAAIPTLKRVVLLIVDDFSQDNGITLLKDWFREQQPQGVSLTLVRLTKRHGMSIALLKGFKLTTQWSPRLTLVMDADGQDDPQFITSMVAQADKTDIVFALRGQRSEPWPFRFCYATFQLLMWLGTGHKALTNQFCVMRTPVLAYVAASSHIDYLGAMLNASPFSRDALTAARRPRGGGKSKFNFRSHLVTALTIMSWQPRLLMRLHRITLLLLFALGILAVSTANFFLTALLVSSAVLAQLWWAKMNAILSRRADSQPFEFDEQVETVTADKEFLASG